MHPYASHVITWLKFLLFCAINTIFTLVRSLVWRLNGTTAEVKRRTEGQQVVNNCHRMRVLFNHFIDIVFPVNQSNFVLVHDGFVDPDYVLRDNVTLLRVTQKEAIFVEQDKAMKPAFSNDYSFATLGQMTTARYLIVMPLVSFLDLAERMENNEEKMVIMHNIGRCGGALFVSCFEATGRAVAWNEPRVLDNIIARANFYWNRKDTRRVLRASFLMLGKTYNGFGERTLAYAIKPSCACASYAEQIFELLPKAKHLLLYRDINVAATSCAKACMLVPCFSLLHLTKLLNYPYAFAYLMDVMVLPAMGFENMTYRCPLFVEFSYRFHLNGLRSYFHLRDKGVPIQAVRYEDLANKPDQILPRLLELASMPLTLTRLAETALRHDAHGMVPFNKKKMDIMRKKTRDDNLSDEFLEEMQELYARDGVPGPLDWKKEPQVIPGTIL